MSEFKTKCCKAIAELVDWCEKHEATISVMDGNVNLFFKSKLSYESEFFYSLNFDKYTGSVRQWDTVVIAELKVLDND